MVSLNGKHPNYKYTRNTNDARERKHAVDKRNFCFLSGKELFELEVDGSRTEGNLYQMLNSSGTTATAGSDVAQSGRPIFDDFFQHLWPYIGNNTANVVFQMVKRLWLIRIDQ
ncbi:hypothetical protein TNCV_3059671 [Trichonephila clavipes]|nr:hypothetical protein TNCV_3059671 [Trichonephila clavipes]